MYMYRYMYMYLYIRYIYLEHTLHTYILYICIKNIAHELYIYIYIYCLSGGKYSDALFEPCLSRVRSGRDEAENLGIAAQHLQTVVQTG